MSQGHLKRRDEEQQAGDNRHAWRDGNDGKQQHDDAERPLSQSAQEPVKGEMLRRHLLQQLAKYD